MRAEHKSLVSIRGASFGYGTRAVVEGVDLEVGAGAFVGVLGPNGAGKTTLLRGLLGLAPPLAGRVERRAVFGYVPQRETLDPVYPLTVEEVVRMGAFGRLFGWRRLDRDDRRLAKESLARVGLTERRKQRFASLSGGQRQRALIARALVARPTVLVLDEPTSGVDAPTQERMVELLTRLNDEDELAIVLVSHQGSITRVVRDVLWVEGGRTHAGVPTGTSGGGGR